MDGLTHAENLRLELLKLAVESEMVTLPEQAGAVVTQLESVVCPDRRPSPPAGSERTSPGGRPA